MHRCFACWAPIHVPCYEARPTLRLQVLIMPLDPLSQATAAVQKLEPYVPGKPITELEREYGITSSIKLASNENPLGPAPAALAALSAGAAQLGLYPDGN